jgi:asparagine synthase (glutamine-hydrolysing)
MWDDQKLATVVFNGELYNFRELVQDLLARGYLSRSDIEVLLNLYLADG